MEKMDVPSLDYLFEGFVRSMEMGGLPPADENVKLRMKQAYYGCAMAMVMGLKGVIDAGQPVLVEEMLAAWGKEVSVFTGMPV